MSREIELRENLVGTGFIEPPQVVARVAKQMANRADHKYEDMEHRVTVLGEIAKATGF